MVKIVVDPESTSLQQHHAVIHTPRKNRKRFPEGCVTLYSDEESARAAGTGAREHPAVVYGPSVSSESQRIYYLVRWLD